MNNPSIDIDLARLLETCLCDFALENGVTGKVIKLPGMRGWTCGHGSPQDSLVEVDPGMHQLTDNELDNMIAQTNQWFDRNGYPYTWLVYPRLHSRLGDRLLNKGYQMVERLNGLVLEDLRRTIHADPAITIRLIQEHEVDWICAWVAQEFAWSERISKAWRTMVLAEGSKDKVRIYAAFLNGDIPAGFAHTVWLEENVAWLRFGFTAPDFRRRQVYSSLLARRIDDARGQGAQACILHAVENTSAPICKKRGFDEVTLIEAYTRWPKNQQNKM